MVKKGIVKFSKIVATFTMVLAVVSVKCNMFLFFTSARYPRLIEKKK